MKYFSSTTFAFEKPIKTTFLFFTIPLRCLLLPPTKCRLSGEKDVKCIKSYTHSSFWAYDGTHAGAFTFANKLSKRDHSSRLLIRKTWIYDKKLYFLLLQIKGIKIVCIFIGFARQEWIIFLFLSMSDRKTHIRVVWRNKKVNHRWMTI